MSGFFSSGGSFGANFGGTFNAGAPLNTGFTPGTSLQPVDLSDLDSQVGINTGDLSPTDLSTGLPSIDGGSGVGAGGAGSVMGARPGTVAGGTALSLSRLLGVAGALSNTAAGVVRAVQAGGQVQPGQMAQGTANQIAAQNAANNANTNSLMMLGLAAGVIALVVSSRKGSR